MEESRKNGLHSPPYEEELCKKIKKKCANFKAKIFEVLVYLMLFNGKKNIICQS